MYQPNEENSVCLSCGLWKNCHKPFMDPDGDAGPDVIVVGEAPGEDEDKLGKPFVGRSGQLLREVTEEVFDPGTKLAYTNVVLCRPPDNKITKKAIDHCKGFAVNFINTKKPKYVLLMGNSALQGILGQTGISNYNGIRIEREGITYIPLLHPAYILRNPSALNDWLATLVEAIDDSNVNKEDAKYIYPMTLNAVEAMATSLQGVEFISFDTEVTKLDAFSDDSAIIAVSFSDGNIAYSVPLLHPESPWTDKELGEVFSIVLDIIKQHSGKIIGHNIKFDRMQVKGTTGCEFASYGDSMLVSHMLDSRQGIHGLKRLAGIHCGMFDYDEELSVYIKAHKEANPKYGGSYANIPLKVLLPYSAKDALATYRLHQVLYDKLDPKQKILYHELIMPASDMLCDMQCNGVAIDYHLASRYWMIYETARDEALKNVLADKKVQKMIADRRAANPKARVPYNFNPNSADQLGELYFQYFKIKPPRGHAKTSKGKYSISSKAMKGLEEKYPIVELVRKYKLLNKMISTYLKPAATGAWSSGDGRVRTTYNLHGTKTGRLSSSQPVNLQNIPTPEKEPGTLLEYKPIKNLFTHSYWEPEKVKAKDCITLETGEVKYFPVYIKKLVSKGVLLSADYSGQELRVFSSVAKCMPMIAIHKSGLDFHSVVAYMAMDHMAVGDVTKEMVKALPKPVRYRYKWTNWTLLYGGDQYTLMHLYGMTEEDANYTVESYYAAFPEVLEYREICRIFAEEHGYIESPFGRREQLFYINDNDERKRNQDIRGAVNMPVQSAASDLLLFSATILRHELPKAGLVSRLVNTVHDSIVLDTPENEIKPAAALVKDVMENVATYAKTYMPSVDFSWLICPLKSDVDVGTHWGAEMKYEEWEANHG